MVGGFTITARFTMSMEPSAAAHDSQVGLAKYAEPLSQRVLAVFDKDVAQWSSADEALLLSLYPRPNRRYIIQMMAVEADFAEIDPLPGLRELIRIQLAAGLDWNEILNPAVRTSWKARLRLREAEVAIEREMKRKLAASRGG